MKFWQATHLQGPQWNPLAEPHMTTERQGGGQRDGWHPKATFVPSTTVCNQEAVMRADEATEPSHSHPTGSDALRLGSYKHATHRARKVNPCQSLSINNRGLGAQQSWLRAILFSQDQKW